MDTLDKWSIKKHLIIGLEFDTTFLNSGVRSGVAVSLEKTFGNKFLLLACRHHVMELLCGAAASMICSPAGSMMKFYEDLSLHKNMVANVKNHESERLRKLSIVVANKLENHVWQLTERLVFLALFGCASVPENQSMAKSMKKYQNDTSFDDLVQQMPAITAFAQLIDLFGPDSWVLFKLINENPVGYFCVNPLPSGKRTKAASGLNLGFIV